MVKSTILTLQNLRASWGAARWTSEAGKWSHINEKYKLHKGYIAESILKVCLCGCYITSAFYQISLCYQLDIVSHRSENYFVTKLKDCRQALFKLKWTLKYYLLLNYYFKAISKVDVNFNQFEVKFTCNPPILSENGFCL